MSSATAELWIRRLLKSLHSHFLFLYIISWLSHMPLSPCAPLFPKSLWDYTSYLSDSFISGWVFFIPTPYCSASYPIKKNSCISSSRQIMNVMEKWAVSTFPFCKAVFLSSCPLVISCSRPAGTGQQEWSWTWVSRPRACRYWCMMRLLTAPPTALDQLANCKLSN